MEDSMSISLAELLSLNIYLGGVIFLIGSLGILWLIVKYKRSIIWIISFVIIQLIISVFLSLVIWRFWPFDGDIMYGFVFLPALISECITIPLVLVFKMRL